MNFYQKLQPREKKLFILTLSVLIPMFTYFLVAGFFKNSSGKTKNDIPMKWKQWEASQKLLASYDSLRKESEKYPALIEKADSEDEAVKQVLLELEQISKVAGCNIVNVKPTPTKAVGNYKRISIEITAEGSVAQFSRFLYDIETSGSILRVKRYTITLKSGSQSVLSGLFLVTKIIS